MEKDITDAIRALDEEEVSVNCALDGEALRRVKARALEKTGVKKSEGNKNMKKKLSRRAIAAIAACLGLILLAAVALPGLLKGGEKLPGGTIGGVPGIRSEFIGLHELKATVANNEFKDGKVTLLATVEIDRSVKQQAREFEELGFETSIADDGSLYLYTTKDAVAGLELPEKLLYTHFRIIYDGAVSRIN